MSPDPFFEFAALFHNCHGNLVKLFEGLDMSSQAAIQSMLIHYELGYQTQKVPNIKEYAPKYENSYEIPEYMGKPENIFYWQCGLQCIPHSDLTDQIVFDGGAFNGDSALMFVKDCGCKVVAFEPNTENYNILLN